MQRETVVRALEANRDEVQSRFGVESLRLFGSVARDSASDESDVDLDIVWDTITRDVPELADRICTIRDEETEEPGDG